MDSELVVAILCVVDAVWMVGLALAWWNLQEDVRELRRWFVAVRDGTSRSGVEVNCHRETGDPDIGTPPLIPPPFDAE